MKHAWVTTLAICLPGAVAALPSGPPVRYVASRDIILEYHATNDAAIRAADLYVSTDAGRTWKPTEAVQAGPGALRYIAAGDGKYEFYLVLRNDVGASAELPQPGSKPVLSVIVDTLPPLLQIHRTRIDFPADDRPLLVLETSLVEENLSETGLRIFYRIQGQDWSDGGTPVGSPGTIAWTPPEFDAATLDLRVVATDLAGNRATTDVLRVTIPARPRQRDSEHDLPAPTSQSVLQESPPIELVWAELTPPPTADGPQPAQRSELQVLRTLAAEFMSQGRHSLAAARLEDALRLAPQDPNLLVDSGNAQYRLGHHKDAGSRFRAAAGLCPDHAGALEGLALVAATEKRYPEAREHLQHVLRLLPESASAWLRYGDIEHRLGNTAQALDAWQRVLKVPRVDTETCEKAQRRLDYFGPGRDHR